MALKQSACQVVMTTAKPNILGGLALEQILPADMAFFTQALPTPEETMWKKKTCLARLDMILSEFTGKDPFYTAFSTNRDSRNGSASLAIHQSPSQCARSYTG